MGSSMQLHPGRWAIGLIALLTVALVACGGSEQPTSAPAPTTPVEVQVPPTVSFIATTVILISHFEHRHRSRVCHWPKDRAGALKGLYDRRWDLLLDASDFSDNHRLLHRGVSGHYGWLDGKKL